MMELSRVRDASLKDSIRKYRRILGALEEEQAVRNRERRCAEERGSQQKLSEVNDGKESNEQSATQDCGMRVPLHPLTSSYVYKKHMRLNSAMRNPKLREMSKRLLNAKDIQAFNSILDEYYEMLERSEDA